MKRINFALILLVCSIIIITFFSGYMVHRQRIFPTPLVEKIWSDAKSIINRNKLPWYYVRTTQSNKIFKHVSKSIQPGLTLITGIGEDRLPVAKVINDQGKVVHQWDIDWFKVWPDAEHLSDEDVPKSKPGALVHGATILQNGDLVFNYEALGMVSLDFCGATNWRLPVRTHHSLYVDDSGNYWTGGVIHRVKYQEQIPNHEPGYEDYSVLKVSPTGKVLKKFSLFEILVENGLNGLLYMSTQNDEYTTVSGDTLHLNDVEVFPASMREGVFKHGDVMVSLRNNSTIFVFDPETRRIKFVKSGLFIRQHDPDFIDGNTISVFDNNNLLSNIKGMGGAKGQYSKITAVTALDGSVQEIFKGTEKTPFFTSTMGKHQLLDNGNILLTESRNGRALEVNSQGDIVWGYRNVVEKGIAGIMTEAQRLPAYFDEKYFFSRQSKCKAVGVKH